MVLTRPNLVQEAILEQRGISLIVSDADDPSVGFLESLVRDTFGATPFVIMSTHPTMRHGTATRDGEHG
jgi:hypothetical protein